LFVCAGAKRLGEMPGAEYAFVPNFTFLYIY
jgi:hypothetical protein